MSTHFENLTQEQKRKIIVGYYTSGNSIWDLIQQFIPDEDVDQEFKDILDQYKDDPVQKDEMVEYYQNIGEEFRQGQMTTIAG